MQKTSVGSIEITALVDLVAPFPATSVYPELGDPARFARYLDAAGAVALGFASYLLREGATLMLVDTGWGPEHNGALLAELAEAGVKPGEVTHVLFTHLHGDHTGWNIDRTSGRPVFANARHLVPEADWEHYGQEAAANAASSRNRPWLSSFETDVKPLEALGLVDLVAGERTITPGLTAIPTPGHTPGHMSVAITSTGERGFILGDVVITSLDAEEPELESMFDFDRKLAVVTRKATLERLVADGSLVGASHLPAPGLGRFVRSDGRTLWRPI